jgi:hypothetical protein
LPRSERYIKESRGEWQVVLLKSRRKKTDGQAAQAEPPLVKELTARGVSAGKAAQLVATHDAEDIRQKIDVHDWLKRRKDGRISRSPAGYLVKSIESRYTAPDGYKSTAQLQAEAEKKQQDSERSQQQFIQSLKDRAERREFSDRWQPVWDALSDPEREGIIDTVAKDNTFLRSHLNRHREGTFDCLVELARRHSKIADNGTATAVLVQ